MIENENQRINLEAGPGTHAFRHLGGTFFGADAMSIVNHHQNWFLNHAPRTNGWDALDAVKRTLEGIKRHPFCDIIQGFQVSGFRFQGEKVKNQKVTVEVPLHRPKFAKTVGHVKLELRA